MYVVSISSSLFHAEPTPPPWVNARNIFNTGYETLRDGDEQIKI